ncbi:MAG: NAD(P)H-dependent oxidoreductase [Ancalomicrobiaceae bacterium]|nr:NAD(P)H-dependent oxidoreductase [Ancalomicrobiaceae bacterium]
MPASPDISLLLLCGSLRSGSVNAAVLATAAACVPAGARGSIYAGMADLPHFNPDDDREPLAAPVADLRRRLGEVDAVLISTPEYAGSLPGSFKNLLDWTVGSGGLYVKPVGWINPSAGGGAKDTYHALCLVLDRAGAAVADAATADIPVGREAIGADGLIADAAICARIAEVVGALVAAVRQRRHS